jgi:hypothetical protein
MTAMPGAASGQCGPSSQGRQSLALAISERGCSSGHKLYETNFVAWTKEQAASFAGIGMRV